MSRILISIGSNQAPERHIRAALQQLADTFGPLRLSPVYESEAVGFLGANFLNLVVACETDQGIAEVCARLKAIEDAGGRVRDGVRFSGRTIDLDLLTYDDVSCQQPVVLPREEITRHAFVLRPMADLCPQAIHPPTGQSYAQLWQDFAAKDQQPLWPVPFRWP